MSTFSQPLQPIRVKHLSLVQKATPIAAASVEEFLTSEGDGLGCMRGLAIAVFCNVIFACLMVAAWELWHLLR